MIVELAPLAVQPRLDMAVPVWLNLELLNMILLNVILLNVIFKLGIA
jgi:hypothetical protein